MHHGSFVEMGELSHIVSFVKFGWVDFIDIIGVNVSFLEKLGLAAVEAEFELVGPVRIENSQV